MQEIFWEEKKFRYPDWQGSWELCVLPIYAQIDIREKLEFVKKGLIKEKRGFSLGICKITLGNWNLLWEFPKSLWEMHFYSGNSLGKCISLWEFIDLLWESSGNFHFALGILWENQIPSGKFQKGPKNTLGKMNLLWEFRVLLWEITFLLWEFQILSGITLGKKKPLWELFFSHAFLRQNSP